MQCRKWRVLQAESEFEMSVVGRMQGGLAFAKAGANTPRARIFSLDIGRLGPTRP